MQASSEILTAVLRKIQLLLAFETSGTTYPTTGHDVPEELNVTNSFWQKKSLWNLKTMENAQKTLLPWTS